MDRIGKYEISALSVLVGICVVYISWAKFRDFKLLRTSKIRISQLYIYPIKSCKGIKISKWPVAATGFELDRVWMLVDNDGKFMTQRNFPKMALIDCKLDINGFGKIEDGASTEMMNLYEAGGSLTISAPSTPSLVIPFKDTASLTEAKDIAIWKSSASAIDEGDIAAKWFTQFLGAPCRLPIRIYALQLLRLQLKTAFADGFPMLLTNESSLQDVNLKMESKGAKTSWNGPVTMRNFRPNIVVSGLNPFEEDNILTFQIQEKFSSNAKPEKFIVASRCTRCRLPNNDPDTGVIGDEPFKTLMSYRRVDEGDKFSPIFGINVVALNKGYHISVNDEIHVLSVGIHDRRGIWRGRKVPISKLEIKKLSN
ncbi:hypothetical protein HK096_006879 [Nowakowskiella sp. JEL0078]|nr:hypothetical protein HK096_006879 [Nowakowskiella sp. JEL0078]